MYPSRIRAAVTLWRSQLSRVAPYYAVKCNPEPAFLNMLFDAGVNFDCASERELIAIKELARGTLPQRVVYANPCKSPRDLNAAKEVGQPISVVDSVEEVEKMAAANYGAGALVRIAVDDTASDMPFSSKFGARKEDVPAILDAAKALQLPLHGFSFHVGSGSRSPKSVANAIEYTSLLFPLLWQYGHVGRMMDIGGGFLPDEGDFRMKSLYIRAALAALPHEKMHVIAEPGRFFAANSFDFFVKVIGKKPGFESGGKQAGWRYTLDDSVYGQFTNILFDQARPHWVRVPAQENDRIRPAVRGTLFGRTCDSLDVIAKAETMEDLEVGDWLWFPRMGAYTRATASEFNGFPMPDVFVPDYVGSRPDFPTDVSELGWRQPKGVTFNAGLKSF